MTNYKEVKVEVLEWLSRKIRIRMTELNLSRQDLTDKTGMNRERVDAICDGKEEPSLSPMMLLAGILNVDWLFFFDEDH